MIFVYIVSNVKVYIDNKALLRIEKYPTSKIKPFPILYFYYILLGVFETLL